MEHAAFTPGRSLRNAHVQSVLSSLPLRRRAIDRRTAALQRDAQRLVLDCGENVRLACLYTPARSEARPLPAVLLHGWEGSAQSLYLLSAAAHLHAAGYDVYRLILRDHGDTQGLNPGLFHSCRLDEVVGGVGAIARRAGGPVALAGFSLGGNFMVRVAVRAPAAAIPVATVVAICPVLHPPSTLEALERAPFFYSAYFMRKWRRSLRRKHDHWPDRYDIDRILRHRDLRSLTEHLVCTYSDYPDLETYLRGYAITGPALESLSVPTQIVLADDDPIIPARDAAQLARPAALRITRSRYGGHCGFLRSLSAPSWADEWIERVFEQAEGTAPAVTDSNAA